MYIVTYDEEDKEWIAVEESEDDFDSDDSLFCDEDVKIIVWDLDDLKQCGIDPDKVEVRD